MHAHPTWAGSWMLELFSLVLVGLYIFVRGKTYFARLLLGHKSTLFIGIPCHPHLLSFKSGPVLKRLNQVF